MPTPTALEKVADDEVFALTEPGQAQLSGSATKLTSSALKVLVLVDGRSSVAELARGMPVLSPADVRDNLSKLLAEGYIRSTKKGAIDGNYIDPGDFFKTIGKPVRLGATDTHTDKQAVAGLSSLQEAGYYVRIARPAAARPKKADGAPKYALVVDDDPDIGKLLEKILRLEGFEVTVAANKAQVLEALRRPDLPDLALLDVNLPDVDGFHILSRMRQHPNLKVVPVIMLTASATRADVLKGLHFGADGYVTKPFNYEVLAKALHTVLGGGEAPAGEKEAKKKD